MLGVYDNSGEGYFPVVRSTGNNKFFRLMGSMAISEAETLYYIMPGYSADIMMHNPMLDEQVYICTLAFQSLNMGDGEAVFSVYGNVNSDFADAEELWIYCDGLMARAEISNDDVVSMELFRYFYDAIYDGRIDTSRDTVIAHLYATNEIDLYADWSSVARLVQVESSRYADIDVQTKRADSGDSLPLWKWLRPTGLDIIQDKSRRLCTINVDTGICMESSLSIYAPLYVEIGMVSINGEAYTMRVQLNIDDMPERLVPQYGIHPGQRLYGATETSRKGKVSEIPTTMIIEGEDVSDKYIFDDDVTIIGADGTLYGRKVVIATYSDPDTTIEMSDVIGVKKDVVTILKIENTYPDGELFSPDGVNAEDYYPPAKMRMGILRIPVCIKSIFSTPESHLAILSAEYIYRDDAGMDSIVGAHAISNYEVDITKKTYTETGDASRDAVASARYIGHYGRNIMGALTMSPITMTGEDIAVHGTVRSAVINDPSAMSVSRGIVRFDVAGAIMAMGTPIGEENVYEGFYRVARSLSNAQTISSVSLKKLYVLTGNYASAWDAISLVPGTSEPSLMMGVISGIKPLADINMTDSQASFDGDLPLGESIISIDGEIMKLTTGTGDDPPSITRGEYGTRITPHAAGADVYYIAECFRNEFLGVVSEIADNKLAIHGGTPIGMPEFGHILIDGAIYEYDGTTSSEITLVDTSCRYGTTPPQIHEGKKAYYVSYITLDDINREDADRCGYNGPYTPTITVPAMCNNDPSTYGAKSIYLLEVRYEAGNPSRVW